MPKGPKEIIKVLPEVIYFLESFDAALVRSAIPTYFVSKIASDYVKVVLSGEGADELFGGYHYLKKFNKSHEMLQTELLYITENLHNTNLQRADRMTMANSIEARVPFLDIKLLNEAFMISPDLKLYSDQNEFVSKEKEFLHTDIEAYGLVKEYYSSFETSFILNEDIRRKIDLLLAESAQLEAEAFLMLNEVIKEYEFDI